MAIKVNWKILTPKQAKKEVNKKPLKKDIDPMIWKLVCRIGPIEDSYNLYYWKILGPWYKVRVIKSSTSELSQEIWKPRTFTVCDKVIEEDIF